MKSHLHKSLKTILQISLLIVGSVILTISLKVFCFASFKVPSGSMEPTLKTGDYIMVNKLVLGPRVFENWMFWQNGNWNMKRLKGYGQINRNEIVVFNFPITNNDRDKIEMDFNAHYVKRCVGIPGDTLSIENGFYKVKGCTDTLGVYINQSILSRQADSTIIPYVLKSISYDSVHNWTIKNLGPLYIPKANDTLQITCNNIELYKKMIVYETGKLVEVKRGIVLLGGQQLNDYSFKQNYYFMSGDWVLDSGDSRYWGLLPEDHIIGKVAFIWKSVDEKSSEYRWNRFFKDPMNQISPSY